MNDLLPAGDLTGLVSCARVTRGFSWAWPCRARMTGMDEELERHKPADRVSWQHHNRGARRAYHAEALRLAGVDGHRAEAGCAEALQGCLDAVALAAHADPAAGDDQISIGGGLVNRSEYLASSRSSRQGRRGRTDDTISARWVPGESGVASAVVTCRCVVMLISRRIAGRCIVSCFRGGTASPGRNAQRLRDRHGGLRQRCQSRGRAPAPP